eukprot:5129520-Alexandrium_andersonii.AAC.1
MHRDTEPSLKDLAALTEEPKRFDSEPLIGGSAALMAEVLHFESLPQEPTALWEFQGLPCMSVAAARRGRGLLGLRVSSLAGFRPSSSVAGVDSFL